MDMVALLVETVSAPAETVVALLCRDLTGGRA